MSDLEIVDLMPDELEAVRLCDLEELEQDDAARKMRVSRQTLQRALYSGRKKIIGAIIIGKAIKIANNETETQ